MGNTINIITTIKTKHEKSPQFRMGLFCVTFCRWGIRTLVYKSKIMSGHSSRLSSQQIFRSRKEKWKPQYASALLWQLYFRYLPLQNSVSHNIQLFKNKSPKVKCWVLLIFVPSCVHLPEICSLSAWGGSWILYEITNFRADCIYWNLGSRE